MRKKRDEKFITIKDVAKEANVSIATVSRVINSGNVKLEKRKKVINAINKLNYVPNSSARNLASVTKTKRVSLIIPDISKEYYSDLIKGFKEAIKIYNYDPIIEEYNYDEQIFDEINNKYELSSEVKGVIQIGDEKKLPNKFIVNWNNKYLNYTDGPYEDKKVCIYSNDKYIKSFLKKKVCANLVEYKKDKDFDIYIAPSLQEALHLYNEGIKKDILTFSNTTEINKICKNIKNLNLDFYGLGVSLARIVIKKILDEEITTINIKLS